MSDERFQEIQLNGKQLIFLCMTAALVLVVAFLSGVLVGRGVRTEKEQALPADSVAADTVAAASTPADAGAGAPVPAAQAAPPALAPPTPADEDLTYRSRLEGKEAPKETLKPIPEPPPSPAAKSGAADAPKEPAKPPVPTRETAPASAAAAKTPAAADVSKAAETALWQEPAGPGYYLKIAAYKDRAQAEALAKRLNGKGYHTYVVPASGGLHSVRIGKYKTRKEADTVRRRLEKEERLKPLISH